VDHIAISYPDIGVVLDRLRKAGVKVIEEARSVGREGRSAMIEGPDSIVIELIEKR
jgi:predicted enzyme related to lactoylglutathione lyase